MADWPEGVRLGYTRSVLRNLSSKSCSQVEVAVRRYFSSLRKEDTITRWGDYLSPNSDPRTGPTGVYLLESTKSGMSSSEFWAMRNLDYFNNCHTGIPSRADCGWDL